MNDSNNLSGGWNSPTTMMQQMIIKMCGDMKFMGIFTIIVGAINSLSLIGAIIGIPLIFAGMRLNEASENFKSYAFSQDENILSQGFEKLGKYFYIYKIITIVGIILALLYIIGIIFFFAFFAEGMMRMMD